MSKPGDIWRSPGGEMELRCGDWREVLKDIEQCDAVITDPPFSQRTHAGQRTGSSIRVSTIEFEALTDLDAGELAREWHARCGFSVIFSDHTGARWHEVAWESFGRIVFAPIPWVKPDAPPRFSGDGPALACEWLVVSRPRITTRCGSLPGFYLESVGKRGGCPEPRFSTAKPLPLMRRLVRDYSRPNDLIVDPYAGSGTTLLAAAIEGRRAIGAELDPKTYDLAVKRLSKGYTPRMQLPERAKPKQISMDDHRARVEAAVLEFAEKHQ